jgi:hypothetical protein
VEKWGDKEKERVEGKETRDENEEELTLCM